MNKKEILDILDNAKNERGEVPMRLVRQAFDKLVQPEERTEERTESHACDLISRQAAIDVVNSIDNLDAKAKGGICINLMGLPPAQPERNVGEWVQVPRFEGDTQPYLECPFCKNKVGWWDLARYCNGCGAKLEGGAV